MKQKYVATDWDVFESFMIWLCIYDPDNEIKIRRCTWYENPAIQFESASFNDDIRIAAIEHGFDIEEHGFNVYVVAQ